MGDSRQPESSTQGHRAARPGRIESVPSAVELCGLDRRTISAWKVGPPRGCFDRTTCRDVSLKFCPGDVSSRTVLLRIDRTVVTAGVCAKPVRAHIDNSTKARASTVCRVKLSRLHGSFPYSWEPRVRAATTALEARRVTVAWMGSGSTILPVSKSKTKSPVIGGGLE